MSEFESGRSTGQKANARHSVMGKDIEKQLYELSTMFRDASEWRPTYGDVVAIYGGWDGHAVARFHRSVRRLVNNPVVIGVVYRYGISQADPPPFVRCKRKCPE